jgi:hypothetical protein
MRAPHRISLSGGSRKHTGHPKSADMSKWMKCIFPRSAKYATELATVEVNRSILVLESQIDSTESQIKDARQALRLLVATGAGKKQLNASIRAVDCLVARSAAKSKIRHNLQEKLGHLGDVEINSQVISAMRHTNGALSAAYGDNEEQEDDAIDLVEEFEKLAETGGHVTGALEASVSLGERPEEEDEEEVNDAALARAMGGIPPRDRTVRVLSVLPEAPRGKADAGVVTASTNQSTNGTRAEIRALRL